MDPTILTPRLKLTLVTKAERGSQELEWLHELRSNEKTTWWGINGQAKSIEDTEKQNARYLPAKEGEYKISYAVHRLLEESPSAEEEEGKPTEIIGLITLVPVDEKSLAISEDIAPVTTTTSLTVELGYMFLPKAWGKGYATESVNAVFDACKSKTARSFWAPFTKLFIRAIVNHGNPASVRVMSKTAMTQRGIYKWTGKIWLAGGWRTEDDLYIFGMNVDLLE